MPRATRPGVRRAFLYTATPYLDGGTTAPCSENVVFCVRVRHSSLPYPLEVSVRRVSTTQTTTRCRDLAESATRALGLQPVSQRGTSLESSRPRDLLVSRNRRRYRPRGSACHAGWAVWIGGSWGEVGGDARWVQHRPIITGPRSLAHSWKGPGQLVVQLTQPRVDAVLPEPGAVKRGVRQARQY
jgi:hypothetical protein